jgi:hypothetical protein
MQIQKAYKNIPSQQLFVWGPGQLLAHLHGMGNVPHRQSLGLIKKRVIYLVSLVSNIWLQGYAMLTWCP